MRLHGDTCLMRARKRLTCLSRLRPLREELKRRYDEFRGNHFGDGRWYLRTRVPALVARRRAHASALEQRRGWYSGGTIRSYAIPYSW